MVGDLISFVRSYPAWVKVSVAFWLVFTLAVIVMFIFAKPESEARTGAVQVPSGEPRETEKVRADELASAFRERDRVRPLNDFEDGLDLSHAPDGVFGFTVPWIIGSESPMNQQRGGTAVLELHKLRDGSAELVAFASQADALRIEARSGVIEVNLFPEPWKEAATPVTIPLHEVISSSQRSFKYGYVLDMRIGKKS